MSKLAAVPNEQVSANEASAPLENGDMFVADTGEYIGQWEGKTAAVPVELCMIVDGYEYVYRMDRREPRAEAES